MKRVVHGIGLGLAVLVTAAVLSSTPTLAFGANEEPHVASQQHHEAAEHHSPGLSDLLFPAVNFGIYLFIVVRFVIPAMREYLRRRHSEVVALQAEYSSGLARAEGDLAVAKSRLAALANEAESIREDLVTIATRQAERLKAQAEETGVRRLADAALLAEQERRHAVAELRGELARAASQLAETRIRGALTSEDQRSFVQQFLREAATK